MKKLISSMVAATGRDPCAMAEPLADTARLGDFPIALDSPPIPVRRKMANLDFGAPCVARSAEREPGLKALCATVLLLTLGGAACAHEPKSYSFTTDRVRDDLDVAIRTLARDGLTPEIVDHKEGTIATAWVNTGYFFREVDLNRDHAYYTNLFLRFRITLQHWRDKDTVVLTPEVQRCPEMDSLVRSIAADEICKPTTTLFASQQKQTDQLGKRLQVALGQM